MGVLLENVVVRFGRSGNDAAAVLDIRSFAVERGRQICVVGGSGSGKTTLLHVLSGIVVPDAGKVQIDDVDLVRLSEHDRDRFRARHIGYVYQTFNLLQGLSALENVTLALAFAGVRRRAARQRARELLERVGLDHRLDAHPSTLSVGEQQRVAIARAVANHPSIVLADEPTANLDESNGDAVLALLREVASEEHSILLLVTHESRIRDKFEDVVPMTEITT